MKVRIIDSAKAFIKERDEMLLKKDVAVFKEFCIKYKRRFDTEFNEAIQKASDELLEVTMHKAILGTKSLPEEVRLESGGWLFERGYAEEGKGND